MSEQENSHNRGCLNILITYAISNAVIPTIIGYVDEKNGNNYLPYSFLWVTVSSSFGSSLGAFFAYFMHRAILDQYTSGDEKYVGPSKTGAVAFIGNEALSHGFYFLGRFIAKGEQVPYDGVIAYVNQLAFTFSQYV